MERMKILGIGLTSTSLKAQESILQKSKVYINVRVKENWVRILHLDMLGGGSEPLCVYGLLVCISGISLPSQIMTSTEVKQKRV